MKILVTLKDFENPHGRGGIAHYYKSLRPYLGEDVVYFTIGKRKDRRSCFDDLKRIFSDFWRFWREIPKFNLVNLNPSLGRAGLLRDGVHLLLAKMRRRKVVVFFRGWSRAAEKGIDRWWRPCFRFFFGRADGLIVLSAEFKQKLRAWGCSAPIWIETTTVSEDLLKQVVLAENGSNSCHLLFLARIEKGKGIYAALGAQEILVRNGFRTRLTVVGEGSERESAEKLMRERKIPDVEFAGYLDGDQKAAVLNSADIYLFPSTHGEGMPNSVLEAMAFGLPVVTTLVGGLAGFFEDGKMGICLADADSEELAAQLQKLVENRELRARIGAFNYDYAREYFRARIVAKRLQSIWKKVSVTPKAEEPEESWFPRFLPFGEGKTGDMEGGQ